MKYTKLEQAGEHSVEQTIEGEFEEVLGLFTEMNVEVLASDPRSVSVGWSSDSVHAPLTTNF